MGEPFRADPLRVGKTIHNVGGLACILGLMMMIPAFITTNSGLVPLIEDLCAEILYFTFGIIFEPIPTIILPDYTET